MPEPGRWIRRSRLHGVESVARDLVRTSIDDDLAGEAAKVSFYFFLSLFPLVLMLFALTGIVGGDEAFDWLAGIAASAVPPYAWNFVHELIEEVTTQERPGILSISILLTLWAASNGIAGLTHGLNAVYDVREGRGWWKRRVLALIVLLVGAVLLVVGAAALAAGVAWLDVAGLGTAWRIASWPLAFVLIALTIWISYYVLPARDQRHAIRETIIGALVATVLWLAAIGMLHLYVANFGRYARTYGSIGAVIVLMLWMYVSVFAVLIGAELAGVLERRAQTKRKDEEPGTVSAG